MRRPRKVSALGWCYSRPVASVRTEPIYTDAYIEDQNISLSENGGIGTQRKKTIMNPMMLLDWSDYQ